jgi:hypothetical protein
LTHNPKDPELDRKAEAASKEIDQPRGRRCNSRPTARKAAWPTHDEIIRFWIKEIEDHAGRSAFNRASDHAAQMESVTKTAPGYRRPRSPPSTARARTTGRSRPNIRALLASALKITTRAKVSAEVVTNGGGA